MITEKELIGPTLQDAIELCRKKQADIWTAEYFLNMFKRTLSKREGIGGTFQIKRDIVRMEAKRREFIKERLKLLSSAWDMCYAMGYNREERRIIMQSI